MWGFYFIIPSLLVTLVFLCYYFILPRIPILQNRLFVYLIIIEQLVIDFDILSSWADNNYADHSTAFLYCVNSTYFVFFFLRTYLFFLLTICLTELLTKRSYLRFVMMFIPTTAISVLVLSAPFDHLFYYIDDSGYHSGPLYMLLYFFFAMYLAISLIVCLFHKDSFKDKKAYGSAIIYNIILVIGLLVRYAIPKILLMDTFCLLAIIIIYLSFVNPDFYLDRLTSAYNSLALKLYLREIHLRKNIKILAVTIRNYRELRDLYGSTQMDKAVVFISNRLKTSFSKDKVFYMRSGMYLVLLENKSNTEQLSRYIHDILIKPFLSANSEIYLETGSALLDIDYKLIPISTIMQLIYLTMDEAGNNTSSDSLTVIDESYTNRIKRESDIKKALNYALDHDGVEVFLQPIVDAKTGNLVGAEALSRIRDADGNLIPPDLFIPIAEQNGTINKLGEIVFKKVCLFINNMDITSKGMSWINVNLSPIQFMRIDLAERLQGILKQTGTDPSLIHLEITEENLTDDSLLINQMETLRDAGFCFALDDYGKGYSNVARLRNCPFINVKIDMSLVWDYMKSPDELLPGVINVLSHLGFEITAEGIEDENMANEIQKLGVTYLQGYYYSKPLPMKDFAIKYLQYTE